MVFGLVLTGCASKSNPMMASWSFDQFIDQAPGDEVPPSVAKANSIYRAKQVSKTIYRHIDKAGYYIDFANQFKTWCELQHGVYKTHSAGIIDAICLSPDEVVMIGGYAIKVTTFATYQGEMTDGTAMFSYMNDEQWQSARIQKDINNSKANAIREAQVKREQAQKVEDARQAKCRNEISAEIRANPKPSVYTNFGMIVEVKHPLVMVQDLARKAPIMWVEINQLEAPASSKYCSR